MDVRIWKAFCLLAFTFIFTACANKNVANTCPDCVNKAGACTSSNAIPTDFVVTWEDGRVTLVKAENKEMFVQKFLEPNLAFVRRAEFNRRILLPAVVQKKTVVEAAVTGPSEYWGQDMIEASAAWSQGVYGQGVKVAVVDTAVDYDHAQLKSRLSVNQPEYNGSAGRDDDGNGYVDDVYGWDFVTQRPKPVVSSTNVHGTHVAGIILADPSKGSMKGVAPSAELIPAAFIDPKNGGDLYAAIEALKYSAARGAKVINASWGGGGNCSDEFFALRETVRSLGNQNILFVVAAGNSGASLDSYPEYPAAFGLPLQLTVGATRWNDLLANFSNNSYNFVHLAAPGSDIFSTVPGGYSWLDGTSMATPFVSGAAALLWSAKPNANVGQIREALMNSVDQRNYRVMTRGRLNVRKALDEIRRLVP